MCGLVMLCYTISIYVILPLYRLCQASYRYLYNFGYDLAKEQRNVHFRKRVWVELLVITSVVQQGGKELPFPDTSRMRYYCLVIMGEMISSITKGSERNGPLARGLSVVPGREVSGGFWGPMKN